MECIEIHRPIMLLKMKKKYGNELIKIDICRNLCLGLPRFPVPEPGNSVVLGTREPGIWSGSKTGSEQALFRQKLCVKSFKIMVVLHFCM